MSAYPESVCGVCSHTRFPADDDNLIILDPIPGQEDCQSDYINACYVDVSVCVCVCVCVWIGALVLMFQCFYCCGHYSYVHVHVAITAMYIVHLCLMRL